MPADAPTIVAGSAGLVAGPEGRRRYDLGPVIRHAIDLSGVEGRAPRVLFVGTASGDPRSHAAELDEAARGAGVEADHLHLFPMPNHPDLLALVLRQDVVWVGGGSVANLLAVWRLHGLDTVFRMAWEAGVVLGGISAGSICWHAGGTTDSFGPALRPVTDGLALLPWGNGVHYDSEAARRPLVHRLVTEGVLPRTYCTDDGVALVYRGTELFEAVGDGRAASAYVVERDPHRGAVETPLPTRRLTRVFT